MEIVSGNERIVLTNLLVGDVWICSGQSNMEWPLAKEMHWPAEKEQAMQPLIRFANPAPAGRYVYGVSYTDSLTRRLNKDSFYLWTGWQVCDSQTIAPMSAVAYYFAKSIVSKTGVPVGLINLSIGGAPAETFISRQAMQSSSRFAGKVKPGNWMQNDALPVWARERAMQNVGNLVNGYGDEWGLNHAYKPAFAFDCGIESLTAMAVQGMIWYQGESNAQQAERVNEYASLMQLMVKDYRKRWKRDDMPVYWVQLSSIDTAHYQSKLWPQFRDEQRKLLTMVRQGGMAVCSDIGLKDNVHPTNKKAVGERLARWALQDVYGQTQIITSGPLPGKASFSKGVLTVDFHYADGLHPEEGKEVTGFSLDGVTDIPAFVRGNHIEIITPEKPAFVYYGWQPFSKGNLVNGESLPASTFKITVQ
jgi:sialate O-acetylesterase